MHYLKVLHILVRANMYLNWSFNFQLANVNWNRCHLMSVRSIVVSSGQFVRGNVTSVMLMMHGNGVCIITLNLVLIA